jgi:hypothetical protein
VGRVTEATQSSSCTHIDFDSILSDEFSAFFCLISLLIVRLGGVRCAIFTSELRCPSPGGVSCDDLSLLLQPLLVGALHKGSYRREEAELLSLLSLAAHRLR